MAAAQQAEARGAIDRAARLYQQALRVPRPAPAVYQRLGLALSALGCHDDAKQALLSAAALTR